MPERLAPTHGLGNPLNFAILLARLAFCSVSMAGLAWYLGLNVPKLFPNLNGGFSGSLLSHSFRFGQHSMMICLVKRGQAMLASNPIKE